MHGSRDLVLAPPPRAETVSRPAQGVVVVDEAGVVVDCDAGAAALLGAAAADLVGRAWSELAPPGSPPPRVMAAGGGLVLLGEGPEPEEALVGRRAVELARALREARWTVADADEFAEAALDSMSHQLRTPLATILGTSEALADDVFGPLDPRARAALGAIEDAGRALLGFVDDVLDLSRSRAGKLELDRVEVDLPRLVREAVDPVRPDALAAHIEVVTAVDPALGAGGGWRLLGDPARLQRALWHLLDNALRFSAPGGLVRVDAEVDGDRARLVVTDSGPGMSPAERLRAGRPFAAGASAGLARAQGGPGLGLAYAGRLAELHGGSLRLTSVLGAGTRVALELPLDRAGPAGRAPAVIEERASPLVLVADDDAASVDTMSIYLRAKGFRVEAVGDGLAAVAAARELRPDAIVMDLQLPGLDGLSAIGRIRNDLAGRSVPIVAVTGLALRGDRDRCLAAGASDYLPKPVSLRGLVRALEALLRPPAGL